MTQPCPTGREPAHAERRSHSSPAGSRGIGLRIALHLWRASGFDLASASRRGRRARRLPRFRPGRRRVHSATTFSRSGGACRRCSTRIMSTGSARIDCLVSNAGMRRRVRGDMLDLLPDHFDRASMSTCAAPLPQPGVARWMLALRRASALDRLRHLGQRRDRLARAGRLLRLEGGALDVGPRPLRCGSRADGIGVFEVRPGIIRTDMTAGVAARYDERIAGGLVPARRWGEGGHRRGGGRRGLASGLSRFATGSVIACDGGLSIARL